MSRADSPDPESAPKTSWSVVREACAESPTGDRAALNALLAAYRPVLLAHVLYKRQVPADLAEDLVQSFIQQKILEGGLLQRADQQKGRLRNLLFTALDHFAIDMWRRQASGLSPGPLPEETAATADADVFTTAWAMQVLLNSFRRMQAECQAKQRSDLWGVFEGRLLAHLQGTEPLSYELLAARLGLASARQASNRYLTAMDMFRRHLRAVLETAADGDPEEEAGVLRQAFLSAGPELLEKLRNLLWNKVPEVTMLNPDEATEPGFRLARLVQLPLPDDFAGQLRQVLAAPVTLDLGALDAVMAARARAWAEGEHLLLMSLGELLHHPRPLPELLQLVKNFAKDSRRDPESPLPPAVATVIYFASIAAALARCRERISQQDSASLRQGLQWCCDQAWVDETTRGLLQEGLRALDSMHP
jgi:DNA-directed RNA polymerase specialized sigma24 family protein